MVKTWEYAFLVALPVHPFEPLCWAHPKRYSCPSVRWCYTFDFFSSSFIYLILDNRQEELCVMIDKEIQQYKLVQIWHGKPLKKSRHNIFTRKSMATALNKGPMRIHWAQCNKIQKSDTYYKLRLHFFKRCYFTTTYLKEACKVEVTIL